MPTMLLMPGMLYISPTLHFVIKTRMFITGTAIYLKALNLKHFHKLDFEKTEVPSVFSNDVCSQSHTISHIFVFT